MFVYFVNDLHIDKHLAHFNPGRRASHAYHKWMDENLLPADTLCIAGDIADSSLYIKNNVDIRYMSYVLAQIEETNTGCIRMFNDGELPKDSFSILLEKAFCEAQRKHAREIVE